MSNVKKGNEIAYANHIKALERISEHGGGANVYRRLRYAEARIHRYAEAQCNGTLKEGEYDRECIKAERVVKSILGQLPAGFFINGNCRGYALKIDNDGAKLPEGLSRDWGGYGILAPDFK